VLHEKAGDDVSNTELDLGALRTLADVSAKMGYKVRLTPAELSALLAAAGEREALRKLIPVVCCEGANPNCYGPRACLVRAQKADSTPSDKLVDEIAALQAEVERLRAACLVEHGGKHHEPECPICAALAPAAAKEVRRV
jgi:hypothetical protein